MVAAGKTEVTDRRFVVRIIRTRARSATVYDADTRSQLEARWAIFFRELGLQWQYEPITLKGGEHSYKPDFHVDGFGYVEIKPTLGLFIQESAKRIAAVAKANPDLKIYAFIGDGVGFGWGKMDGCSVALYHGDKLFAATTEQVAALLCSARDKAHGLSDDQQIANIRRAVIVASRTRINEWMSTKDLVSEFLQELKP